MADLIFHTDKKLDRVFIAAKNRVVGPGCLYKTNEDVEFMGEAFKVGSGSVNPQNLHISSSCGFSPLLQGETLRGTRYQTPFNYFAHRKETAFRVVVDTYVTDDSGTGVVHQAPGHGEVCFLRLLN